MSQDFRIVGIKELILTGSTSGGFVFLTTEPNSDVYSPFVLINGVKKCYTDNYQRKEVFCQF